MLCMRFVCRFKKAVVVLLSHSQRTPSSALIRMYWYIRTEVKMDAKVR